MTITAGHLRSSRAMPAVCSFKHVWEKKIAFSYCILLLRPMSVRPLAVPGVWLCQGAVGQAATAVPACKISPNLSGLLSPRTGLRLGKVLPLEPVHQPGSCGSLVISHLINMAVVWVSLSSHAPSQLTVCSAGRDFSLISSYG